MACRSCGKVRAGVDFFSRPQFAVEIPGGDQGQGLVMIPAAPTPHLIIGQAALAFAALQTLLNAMLRLRHAREFASRGVGCRIAEIVVVLKLPGVVA